jgi:plasmid maintenance system antidote protein VapI
MRWVLKQEIVKRFGTQLAASRYLNIPESRLSHIVRGHDQPTARERAVLERALGQTIFEDASQGNAA